MIKGTLSEVLAAWMSSRPVSIICADLTCGGAGKGVRSIIHNWIHGEAFRNAYLILNVCVGRETGEFRQLLRTFSEAMNIPMAEVHRATAAIAFHLAHLGGANIYGDKWCAKELDEIDCQALDAFYQDRVVTEWNRLREFARDDDSSRCVLAWRYKAHRMQMDQIIVRPYPDAPRTDEVPDEAIRMRRHIAAKLAWNTMRHAN